MAKAKQLPARYKLAMTFRYDRASGKLYKTNTARTVSTVLKEREVTSKNMDGYIVTQFCGRTCLAHRIIYKLETGNDVPDGYVLDHINGDKGDNKWCNLRVVDYSENAAAQVRKKRCKDLPTGVNEYVSKWVNGVPVVRYLVSVKPKNKDAIKMVFDDKDAAIAALISLLEKHRSKETVARRTSTLK